MKKIVFILLSLAAAVTARAQIIQSSALTVEMTGYEKAALKGGYKGMFEAGLAVDCVYGSFNYEFTTAHGYRFASGLFLGAGTGVSTLRGYTHDNLEGRLASLPLFADVRWYFKSRHAARFFAGTRLGYAIALNKKEAGSSRSNIHTMNGGEFDDVEETSVITDYQFKKLSGLYFSIGFGFEFKRVSLSLNYLIQCELREGRYTSDLYKNGIYDPNSSYSDSDKYRDYDNSSLLLRIGINF